MENPGDKICNVIQSVIGLAFYFWSWFFLLVVPLAAMVGVYAVYNAASNPNLGRALILGSILLFLIVGLGLLLRWFGRGVLQGSRTKTLFAALATLALGSKVVWDNIAFPEPALTMGDMALYGALGLFLIVASLGLFWVLVDKGRRHEA